MLHKLRTLDLAIALNALPIVFESVVQEVRIGKKAKLVKRAIYKAQPVLYTKMQLRNRQGLPSKLPKNGALDVMPDFIRAIDAAKDARPFN